MRKFKGLVALFTLSFILLFTSRVLACPTVILDGKQLSFDVPPTIENGRTLVPLRTIFEALGADVEWDNTTSTVTAIKDVTSIKLTIDQATAYKNENPVNLDVPGKIVNGRTMVPLRFVGEALGANVGWDPETQTAEISTGYSDTSNALSTSGDEARINKEGGLHVTCGITGGDVRQEDIDETIKILNDRAARLGFNNFVIGQDVADRIIIDVVGKDSTDQEDKLSILIQPFHIEIRDEEGNTILQDFVKEAFAVKSKETYSITLELKPKYAALFAQTTAANIGKHLAFMVDGKVISAPVVIEAINGGKCHITTCYTEEVANNFASLISTGPLPVDLNLLSESLIQPQ